MGMSTHGHQQLSEHHTGHAGSHADAKVRYTMLAVLLVVAELLTASAFESGGERPIYLWTMSVHAQSLSQRAEIVSGSMRPVPITAAVKWSLVLSYAVEGPTL